MRSRYSAFALGEVSWLITSLASAHEDREKEPRTLTHVLREVCRSHRFMSLRVLHVDEDAAAGRAVVRFHARVFSGGRDQSFEETSDFVREGSAWRYVGAKIE